MEDQELKQFVTCSNKNMIDRNVSGYILSDDYLDRCDIRPIVGEHVKILPDIADGDSYFRQKLFVDEISGKWVSLIGDTVNQYYDMKLSQQHWKYVLQPFLRTFIGEAYVKYKKYQLIKKENIYMNYMPVRTILNGYWDVLGAMQFNMGYHSSIWAEILKYFGKEVTVRPDCQSNPPGTRIKQGIRVLFQNPRLFKHVLLAKISKDATGQTDRAEKQWPDYVGNAEVCIVESRMPEDYNAYFVEQSKGRIVVCDGSIFSDETNRLLQNVKPDFEARKKVFSNFRFQDGFNSFLLTVMPRYLPVSMFEGAPVLYRKADEACRNLNIRKLYHSAVTFEFFRYAAGCLKEKGAQICDIQHSFAYGIFYLGYDEYELYDKFLSWGWSLDKEGFNEIVPVAISRVPKIPAVKKIRKDKVLIASVYNTELRKYGSGILYGQYADNLMRFLDELPVYLRKKAVIRTDITDELTDFRIHCRKKYPYIKFENLFEKSFTDSLLESSLLICDHFGSPHMEAAILGRPFVMFDSVKVVRFQPAYVPYLKEMDKLGIYKQDGTELAKELSRHRDVNEWLRSAEITDFIRKYVNDLAGADKDGKEAWYQEFCS